MRPLKEKFQRFGPSALRSWSIGRGKTKRAGWPVAASRSIGGAAGIAEAEQGGHLVEGLAGGVVEGLAEQAVLAPGRHVEQQGVPAAHQQRHERRREGRVFEGGREEVAFQVVHTDERLPGGPGERLAVHHPDQQRADQARPGGHRDRVDRDRA